MSLGRSVWTGLIILLISVPLSGCGPSSQQQTATAVALTAAVPTSTPTVAPTQSASSSAEDYYQEGKEYYQENDLNSALEAFSNAIEIEPDYADAYIERGRMYALQGVFDLAIEDLTTAIEIDPDNVIPHVLRALAYDDTGQYGLAVEDYNFAIEHDPEFAGLPQAYLFRGRGLAMTGEVEMATLDIELALELGLAPDEEETAQRILVFIADLKDLMATNVNLDGQWTGYTAQGEIFEFTVESGFITSYSVGFRIPGCEYAWLDATGGQRGSVEGIRIIVEDDSTMFRGIFTSTGTAFGSIEINPIFCERLVTTWGTELVR